jgi:hypothetical protein
MNSPLNNRICLHLMQAGIRGMNDSDPPCMLIRCADYESCLLKILSSQAGIRELRHSRTRRTHRGEWWRLHP